VVGYTSGSDPTRTCDRELTEQAATIMRECRRRGLNLLEVVCDREPANGKGLGRPGLAYALERIAAGQAQGLVVAELSRITWSAAELGEVIDWLARSNARLVAAAHALDTEDDDGRLAAQVLREVSRWERARLSARTRNGLEAARRSGRSTGRPAVTDDPDLSERIAQMRAQGMTLQAIADRLNEEGVPTVRGGARWRHSSVQVAAGYRRRRDRVARGQPIL
jgi:DNA invertase Pin-like site-specific DNA recombinase